MSIILLLSWYSYWCRVLNSSGHKLPICYNATTTRVFTAEYNIFNFDLCVWISPLMDVVHVYDTITETLNTTLWVLRVSYKLVSILTLCSISNSWLFVAWVRNWEIERERVRGKWNVCQQRIRLGWFLR